MHPAACLSDSDDITSRLGEITRLAIIIHGSGDAAISAECVDITRKGLQNADDIVWVDGAANAPNITHPDIVNASLRLFLERVAQPGDRTWASARTQPDPLKFACYF